MEKSGGKVRSYPILPKEPLALPLLAHLATVEDELDFVFDMTDRTCLNILDRVTKGVAWNHWLRAQRDTFLAIAFTKDERNRIFAWSGQGAAKSRRKSMADRYDSMNWMSYADRLAKLTNSYWRHQQISPEVQAWLRSLPPSLKAPDVAAAPL